MVTKTRPGAPTPGLSTRGKSSKRSITYQGNATPGVVALPVEYTPERFREAMDSLGVEVRYNVRSDRRQYRRAGFYDLSADAWIPDTQWTDWTDADSLTIRAELSASMFGAWRGNYHQGVFVDDGMPELRFCLDLNGKQFEDAIGLLAAVNQVDPLIDYLDNGIPFWDGIPRLSAWLFKCFDVADDSEDLAEWVSTFIFLGAVQRAYEPGCKLDETPVLIGPPGIGKSTALRLAFPPELVDLFTDGLNLATDAKQRAEALQGRAIVEIGEMAGARRADIESLKAFLSRTDDGAIRFAYRRNPDPLPRRCIVVGTADRNDPLPPDHNLRRFVPVTLTGGNVGRLMAFMDRYRGQLWAEALEVYQRGRDARLPDDLKVQQREATDAARYTDAIAEGVAEYVASGPPTFTLEAVAYALRLIEHPNAGAMLTPADQGRLGAALRQCGYEKKRARVNGTLKYIYGKVRASV